MWDDDGNLALYGHLSYFNLTIIDKNKEVDVVNNLTGILG